MFKKRHFLLFPTYFGLRLFYHLRVLVTEPGVPGMFKPLLSGCQRIKRPTDSSVELLKTWLWLPLQAFASFDIFDRTTNGFSPGSTMSVFPQVIGNEFRMRNPPAASRDIVAADAPALSELYEDPASKSGENLLFYTRSSPSFAGVREFWNQHNDNVELLAVLRPRSESAVQAAVRFLTQHNIPLSVRSGGRGAYHQGRADAGGVVIDMRAMDEVSYNTPINSDIPYAVATVGGGITVGPLGRSLHSRNLITPTGWSSEIGFAGWLSGGGYGFLSTRWGLGVDNLVGARLVTSSGEIIDTDDEPNTDFLWALRGAGNGTLGVLTELRVKAFLAPRFLCGVIAFPLSTAADVIRNFREILKAENLPDAVAGESIVMYPPGLQPLFAFLFVWAIDQLGPPEQAQKWLGLIRSCGNLVMDTVTESKRKSFRKVPILIWQCPSMSSMSGSRQRLQRATATICGLAIHAAPISTRQQLRSLSEIHHPITSRLWSYTTRVERRWISILTQASPSVKSTLPTVL